MYKNITVSRGVNYHYYVSPPIDQPWLLFLHGFPSSSHDWHHQLTYFQSHGYGLIAPDMLGYGSTSKPTQPESFKSTLICKDIIDLLDAEQVPTAIAIGHDWGSKIVSRLANYHPDRFSALAFLSVSYTPPDTAFDMQQLLAFSKQIAGYEAVGYWMFFIQDGADKVIEEHLETFFNVLWPDDARTWVTDGAPLGAFEKALRADKPLPRASWLPDEDRTYQYDLLKKNGFASPLMWYKVMASGIDAEDNKAADPSTYEVTKPVFYGCDTKADLAVTTMIKGTTAQYCKGPTTVVNFDAGHWVMIEQRDRVNEALLAWLKSIL